MIRVSELIYTYLNYSPDPLNILEILYYLLCVVPKMTIVALQTITMKHVTWSFFRPTSAHIRQLNPLLNSYFPQPFTCVCLQLRISTPRRFSPLSQVISKESTQIERNAKKVHNIYRKTLIFIDLVNRRFTPYKCAPHKYCMLQLRFLDNCWTISPSCSHDLSGL